MIPISEARTVHFMGGLGDVIRRCYLTDSWVSLEDVEETVNVIVGSGNLYAQELLWWHPRRKHLRILPASHLWLEARQADRKRPSDEIQDEIYQFFGISPDSEKSRYLGHEKRASPAFYPSSPIEMPPRSVVVQPGSRGKYRVLKEETVRDMILQLADMDLQVFVVTRLETPPSGITHPNVHFCSPPAPDTLRMVQKADAFLGSHSALTQLAWFERKPAFVLYPDDHPEWITEHRFTFGKNYETTSGVPFSEYSTQRVAAFVEKFIP